MKTAIAILTYRRLTVLQEMLRGIQKHCPQHPIAIFEDCGQRDGTEAFLQRGCTKKDRPDLMAAEYLPQIVALTEEEKLLNVKPELRYHSFAGTVNLGVSGNSNRAIRWFLEETDADHLCLCNDDLHVLGDFASVYAKAHDELGVGHFCFTDFAYDESYKWVTIRSRGWKLKLFTRYTGIMMSLTRQCVKDVGYYDVRFGKFGNEHCDYSNRCRFAGHVSIDGAPQNCLDIDPDPAVLRHQDVETSVVGEERKRCDREAYEIMKQISAEYRSRHFYRPFALLRPALAGGYRGGGIPVDNLEGYKLVTELV